MTDPAERSAQFIAQLFALKGEHALVTGASRGIGAAVARALASAGATVTGTATTPAGADAITAAFREEGLPVRGAVLDFAKADAPGVLDAIVADAPAPVSILVNNAGITRDNLLMRMKDEEWDSVIRANLSSVFLASRALLKGMLKLRRGRIINMGSVVGAMGNPGQANYAASKAGMIGFTRSLAREVASRGITVNAVAPGFIRTDMTAGLTDGQQQELSGRIPLARLGTVEDVAAAVLYLASPAGAYVTGETLHVNGGLLMS